MNDQTVFNSRSKTEMLLEKCSVDVTFTYLSVNERGSTLTRIPSSLVTNICNRYICTFYTIVVRKLQRHINQWYNFIYFVYFFINKCHNFVNKLFIFIS